MLLYRELSDTIIKGFYNVHHELKGGFLESVYENSLMVELRDLGLNAENQKALSVFYKNELVGDFRADLVVEDKILIEVKAGTSLSQKHDAQVLNYLRVTGLKIGFLVNFSERLQFKRLVY